MEVMYKVSAGLDVHLKNVVVTVLQEGMEEVREFSTYPEDLRKMSKYLKEQGVELAVMESTGVFWNSVYRSLERHGIKAYVVNAKHVKQLPGRKTDISDSKWLAKLGKYGLVKGSFIPCNELGNLRLITRYRLKVKSMIASEINRIRKVLNDSGIRLGMVFSFIIANYAACEATRITM